MEIIVEDLITQQQAEQLLENTTDGPWYLPAGHSAEDEKLAMSAPDLARTVIWLWEQNQQQQAKIERLQAGGLETSRGEWDYATPDDMEEELESLIEGDMK